MMRNDVDDLEAIQTILDNPEHLVGLTSRTLPDERTHRKEQVAAALRLFARFGVTEGLAGHITARDPEHQGHFWVNPTGRHFSEMRVSDLLLVDHHGTVVDGHGSLNKAAFAIHSRLHAARPDVIGATHSHSTYGKIWATTGRLLDPLSQDACAFFEDHVFYDDFDGVVVGIDQADRIAEALGTRKAAILRNHGLLTVGQSVEEAAWWFLAMESACEVQTKAEMLGKPLLIDEDTARRTRDQVGSPLTGRLQFDNECRLLDWDDIRR